VVEFDLVSRHFHGGAEENHEKYHDNLSTGRDLN
jgi:hypothetical protein